MRARLCLVMVSLLLAGEPQAAEPPGYFPKRLWQERTTECDGGGTFRRQLMTDFTASWYGGVLSAAGEAPLMEGSPDAWRFLWLRTFHKPVVVRVERRGAGYRMTARRLSGQGGYEPGTVEASIRRDLTKEEAAQFHRLAEAPGLAQDSRANCAIGADGAQWVVESRVGGIYRFQDEWTPEAGDVSVFGRFLLGLTGWDVEPIY